jgi:hypothetical protein
MRTESFIAPAIFGFIVVLGTALVFSGTAGEWRWWTPTRFAITRSAFASAASIPPERPLRRRDAAGPWARHRLEELASSPQVRIELAACGAVLRDRDGRRCAVLYADGPRRRAHDDP